MTKLEFIAALRAKLHMLSKEEREDAVQFYEEYAAANGCRYLRMDTNEINTAARGLYRKLGYREVGIVDCEFNGIPGVHLVCLEKYLGE